MGSSAGVGGDLFPRSLPCRIPEVLQLVGVGRLSGRRRAAPRTVKRMSCRRVRPDLAQTEKGPQRSSRAGLSMLMLAHVHDQKVEIVEGPEPLPREGIAAISDLPAAFNRTARIGGTIIAGRSGTRDRRPIDAGHLFAAGAAPSCCHTSKGSPQKDQSNGVMIRAAASAVAHSRF